MGIESALPAGNNDGITIATDSALPSCGLCLEHIHPPLLPTFRFPCCKTHICTGCKAEYESSDHAGSSHNCPFCRKQYRPEPLRPQTEMLEDRPRGPPTPRAAMEMNLERQILAQRAAREAAREQGGGGESGGGVDEGDEDENGGEGGVEGGRMRRGFRRLREGVRRRLRRGRRGGEEEEGEGEEEGDEEE